MTTETNIRDRIEAIYGGDSGYGDTLKIVRPHFEHYSKEFQKQKQLFIPVEKCPDPIKISPVDTQVLMFNNVYFYDNTLSWAEFVRGVACVAHLVPTKEYNVIVAALELYVKKMENAKEPLLPEIDDEFEVSLSRIENIIFTNGEPSSWKALLVFATGCYWLLGLIKRVNTKRGNMTPLQFVETMLEHYSRLGYTPKG